MKLRCKVSYYHVLFSCCTEVWLWIKHSFHTIVYRFVNFYYWSKQLCGLVFDMFPGTKQKRTVNNTFKVYIGMKNWEGCFIFADFRWNGKPHKRTCLDTVLIWKGSYASKAAWSYFSETSHLCDLCYWTVLTIPRSIQFLVLETPTSALKLIQKKPVYPESLIYFSP